MRGHERHFLSGVVLVGGGRVAEHFDLADTAKVVSGISGTRRGQEAQGERFRSARQGAGAPGAGMAGSKLPEAPGVGGCHVGGRP